MVRVHTLRVTKWEEVRRGKETVSNGLEDGATLLRENNTVYHRRVIRGLLSFCFFFRGGAKEGGFIECFRSGKDRFQFVYLMIAFIKFETD